MIKFLLNSITLIFFFFILISCGISPSNENLSLNDRENSSKYSRLEGLVEVKGNDVFITVNPDCKCRRSFKVVGEKREELKRLNGLFVEVKGNVKEYTPWSGEILVKKIYILEK